MNQRDFNGKAEEYLSLVKQEIIEQKDAEINKLKDERDELKRMVKAFCRELDANQQDCEHLHSRIEELEAVNARYREMLKNIANADYVTYDMVIKIAQEAVND